jgi:hypothetical protein
MEREINGPRDQAFAMLRHRRGEFLDSLSINGHGASMPGTLVIHSVFSLRTRKSTCTPIVRCTARGKRYFRGVARTAFNGRYYLPEINAMPLGLRDGNGIQLANFDLQLSPYGTFNGEFKLSEEAAPGYYTFENPLHEFYFYFQVAEYRKPEINLNVDFSADEIELGQSSEATVNARYFFDAPVSDANVQWYLYAKPDYFFLPNYAVGLIDTSWLDVYRFPVNLVLTTFGNFVDEGTRSNDPAGNSVHRTARHPQE